MFNRAFTHDWVTCSIPSVSVRLRTSSSGWIGSRRKRRIDSSGPSTATGGITAFTRDPSGRRASTSGEDSSTRRPTRETIFSMIRSRCWLSLNSTGVRYSLPCRSTYTSRGVVTRMSDTVGSWSSGSSGPSPNTSFRTSSVTRSFSTRLSGVVSSSTSRATAARISIRTRSPPNEDSASRLMRSISLRWSENFSSWYSGASGCALNKRVTQLASPRLPTATVVAIPVFSSLVGAIPR